MKQKIVIQLQLNSDKCRSKALKIAAEEKGVNSVSLEGEERDRLVVTGDVDAVCLARELRKKFCCVNLVSVEKVKNKDKDELQGKNENIMCCCTSCPPPPQYCGPCPSNYYVVYDPHPYDCSIM